jgi:hypothetical protein
MRHAFLAGFLGGLCSLPVALSAASVTGLNAFVNGTVADADAVNANFSAVQIAVDDNDARLDALETAPGLASCRRVIAADRTFTGTYSLGSVATCDPDEVLTGGACVVDTASAGTAGLIGVDGSGVPNSYNCIPGGGSDGVRAYAICCAR